MLETKEANNFPKCCVGEWQKWEEGYPQGQGLQKLPECWGCVLALELVKNHRAVT